MPKMLTLIVWATPYSGQGMATAIRLAVRAPDQTGHPFRPKAEATLDKGHRVHIHATGDGVHAFTRGQGAKGVPNVEEGLRRLLDRGLPVDL